MEMFKVTEIKIGYHPDGFRIDRTASPMNYYTRWDISEDGTWHNPKPVDHDIFPEDGSHKADSFDWT